jgi:hypothetical protein
MNIQNYPIDKIDIFIKNKMSLLQCECGADPNFEGGYFGENQVCIMCNKCNAMKFYYIGHLINEHKK